MAADARIEASSKSAGGASPHHHSAAARENALSVDSLLGAHVAGFRIDRLLCSRGLGAVYEGVQEWPPRSVATKISHLNCSPDMARRYERRSKTVQALKHPRIAATYSSGVEPWAGLNVPFQVMEHVANATPLRRFVISRSLSVQQRLSLFREVCDAVAYGHRQGVFHGYLTPQKVLLDPTGSP
jgi:serine/threonine protein kinase